MFCGTKKQPAGALTILAGLIILAAGRAGWGMPDPPIFAGQTPQHVIAADFNADGLADLAVATAFDDRVSIFLQTNAGGWTPSQTIMAGLNSGANQPRFLQIADINSDNRPDLVVLCSGGFAFGAKPSLQSLINLGDGQFARLPADPTTIQFPTEKFPVQFVIADFTGDGYADAVTANLDDKSLTLMTGDGTGRYHSPMDIPISGPLNAGPADLAVADINFDGRDDLIVATSTRVFILRQSPGGGFNSPSSLPGPADQHTFTAVTTDDFDGDGRLDIAAADERGGVVIWHGIHPMMNAEPRIEILRHSSLSGCADIIALPWDNDLLPDPAVCNRGAGTVTVFGSAGGVFVYPVAAAPRRLEAGDMDGDGRLDLLTGNEGDQVNAQNSDVSLIHNPHWPLALYEACLIDAQPLPPLFDGWSPWPAGLSAPEDDRFWLLTQNRRALMEVRADGRAENNGQPRHVFGYAAGGFDMMNDGEGFAVERFAARIHEFEVGENQETIINFNFAPGELGFTGLAYDRDQEEFFIAAPAKNAVVRLNENGQVLQILNIAPAAWELAWDDDADRLLAVHPGRSDVRAFTRTGSPDPGRSFDLRIRSAVFRAGLAGVAFERDHEEIYIVTSAGMLARLSRAGTVFETGAAAPLSAGGPLGFDAGRDEIYSLGADGFVIVWRPGEDGERRRINLWPALAARPGFQPGGVCYDPNSGNVLVADRQRPMIAIFEREGSFSGFLDISNPGPGPGPRGGLAVRPGDGLLLFHERYLATNDNGQISIPTPLAPVIDLALRDDILLTGFAHSLEAVVTPYEFSGPAGPAMQPRAASALSLRPVHSVGGFTFSSAGDLFRLIASPNGAPILEHWNFSAVTAANPVWAQYE